MSASNEPPVVFISYAHYDGKDNCRPMVAAFSAQLLKNGVNCHIDQYEENDPPKDWPLWMQQQIEGSAFVLVVCTETLRKRFTNEEAGSGGKGARWEGAIIRAEAYANTTDKHKFIPLTNGSRALTEINIPHPLGTTTSYDMTSEADFDKLLRRLHRQPAIEKPELGPKPDLSLKAHVSPPTPSRVRAEAHSLLRSKDTMGLKMLISQEIQRFEEGIDRLGFSVADPVSHEDQIRERIAAYQSCAEPIAAVMTEIAYYGEPDHVSLLSDILPLLLDEVINVGSWTPLWAELRRYPCLYCLYAAGSAAMAARNYIALSALLLEPMYFSRDANRKVRIFERINTGFIFSGLKGYLDQPVKNAKFPASEFMVTQIPSVLTPLMSGAKAEIAFDQFEFFLALIAWEHYQWLLGGRFVYKIQGAYGSGEDYISDPVSSDLAKGQNSKILAAGFMDKSLESFETNYRALRGAIEKRSPY